MNRSPWRACALIAAMAASAASPRTALAAHPSVPATDFKGLVQATGQARGQYAMGSRSAGSLPHQLQAFMDERYGLQTLHVACKGENPMAMDLVGGMIRMTLGAVATLRPFIEAGKQRPLAMAGPRRAKSLPEVPAFGEQGYRDVVHTVTGPVSLMAPARTPDAIVERLGREVAAVMQQPSIRPRVESMGLEVMGNTPAEATAAYAAALPVSVELARSTGVTLD